jgi:hypothetical protein
LIAAKNSRQLVVLSRFGKHLLHLPREMTNFGNGDSAFAYVTVLTYGLRGRWAGLDVAGPPTSLLIFLSNFP